MPKSNTREGLILALKDGLPEEVFKQLVYSFLCSYSVSFTAGWLLESLNSRAGIGCWSYERLWQHLSALKWRVKACKAFPVCNWPRLGSKRFWKPTKVLLHPPQIQRRARKLKAFFLELRQLIRLCPGAQLHGAAV
jgi:hypothetical protein